LLAREILQGEKGGAEQADFIGRNLAKVQLALGDAALTVLGAYHWSASERHSRLVRLAQRLAPSWSLPVIQKHAEGLAFKFHPWKWQNSRGEFEREHASLWALAAEVWLWIENSRLGRNFSNATEYALDREPKFKFGVAWENLLRNGRTFGVIGLLNGQACRYPRERLFSTLPLLLSMQEFSHEPNVLQHLQRQLCDTASDWRGLVDAYKYAWQSYG
jgi:hypothetical protein